MQPKKIVRNGLIGFAFGVVLMLGLGYSVSTADAAPSPAAAVQ